MFGRSSKSGREGAQGAAGGESSLCRGQELKGPDWWLPGGRRSRDTARPACSFLPPSAPPSLLGAFWAPFVQFCCLSSSLPLSSSLFWSLTPARCQAWVGALCLLRGSMSLCVCERGAGSLCLFPVDVEHPGVRTPSLLTPHPLHYGARVLTSWWGQRRLVREEPAGLEGRAVPGASASPAAIKVQT